MRQQMTEVGQAAQQGSSESGRLGSLLSITGYILAISYPVLALSTGARALYQLLLKEGVVNYFAPTMTGVAALCYLTATIGFAYRRHWAWYLSMGVLLFETLMTLLVGTLSYFIPELIGRTVWRHFGVDYGYFPLFQPLLGLLWLFWPQTLQAYGVAFGKIRNRRQSQETSGVVK